MFWHLSAPLVAMASLAIPATITAAPTIAIAFQNFPQLQLPANSNSFSFMFT